MDNLSPERRSTNMRRIRSKNSSPELVVRKMAYALGFRYRLHIKHLPGKPDLVFSRLKKIVFVHGCFWHSHEGCIDGRIPKSRREYWEAKLSRNQQRDQEIQKLLAEKGWEVLVIWECQTKKKEYLENILLSFLRSPGEIN